MATQRLFYLVGVIISLGWPSVTADNLMSAAEWNHWYDRIAGDDTDLNMYRVRNLLALMRLHQGAAEPVDEIKKAMIDYWYDVNIDKLEHCKLDFVNDLKSRCEELKREQNRILAHSCEASYKKMIKDCNRRFVALADMNIHLSEYERRKLFEFGDLFGQPDILHKFGRHMASIVGRAATQSLDEFVAAWQSGLCKKLRDSFEELKEAYPDTCNLIIHLRGQPDEVRQWTRALTACEEYNSRERLSEMFKYVKI